MQIFVRFFDDFVDFLVKNLCKHVQREGRFESIEVQSKVITEFVKLCLSILSGDGSTKELVVFLRDSKTQCRRQTDEETDVDIIYIIRVLKVVDRGFEETEECFVLHGMPQSAIEDFGDEELDRLAHRIRLGSRNEKQVGFFESRQRSVGTIVGSDFDKRKRSKLRYGFAFGRESVNEEVDPAG